MDIFNLGRLFKNFEKIFIHQNKITQDEFLFLRKISPGPIHAPNMEPMELATISNTSKLLPSCI
jgi:hypothetical protein